MSAININEIFKLLPHRYPMMLVDRVLEYQLGERLVAIKNVTFNEPFFNGHFPDNPVMPGVFVVEALAQAGCILAFLSTGTRPSPDEVYLFAGADNTRFKRVVIPGDQLRLEVIMTKVRGRVLKIQGTATVDGEVACTTEIMSVKAGIEK